MDWIRSPDSGVRSISWKALALLILSSRLWLKEGKSYSKMILEGRCAGLLVPDLCLDLLKIKESYSTRLRVCSGGRDYNASALHSKIKDWTLSRALLGFMSVHCNGSIIPLATGISHLAFRDLRN